MRTTRRSGYDRSMTTQPHEPTATPRPGDPDQPDTDPDVEGNPVTPPNPAENPQA
jgi:hypothetical protein